MTVDNYRAADAPHAELFLLLQMFEIAILRRTASEYDSPLMPVGAAASEIDKA